MARLMLTIQFQTDQVRDEKRINVRSNLPAGDLVTAVQKRFSLDGLYELKNAGRTLDSNQPLDEQGISDQTRLVFAAVKLQRSDTAELVARGQRRELSVSKTRVFVRDDRDGFEYDIAWSPAILGRRDPRDSSHNQLLAVDLEEAPEAQFVSRHHACLLEEGGSFYIEALSERNPTYLNNAPLRFGVRSLLSPGDRVLVGKISLTFYIID